MTALECTEASETPAKGNKRFASNCLECGARFHHDRRDAEFCSRPCIQAWNNRRAVRGAEMYDLFMALRFQRELATEMQLRTVMTQLASAFREDDLKKRAGRRSWRKPHAAVEKHVHLKAQVLVKGSDTKGIGALKYSR